MTVLALAWTAHGSDLSGVIRDPDGAGVPGTLVVAYDRRFRYRTASTGEDGSWIIEDIRPGPWRMRVLPAASAEVAETWLGDTLQACGSEEVVVPLDGDASREVFLPWGAEIRGRAVLPDGEPLVSSEIRAIPVWHREASVAGRSALTDADGRFRITGVPPAPEPFPPSYLLEVLPGAAPGQFFQGAWTEEGGTLVQVEAPATVDVGEIDVRDGVTLHGRALGPDGAPLDQGTVSVSTSSRTVQVPVQPDGTWSASGLRPGDLLVWVTSPGYGRTYWPDHDRPGPRVIAPDDGQIVVGVDLQMPEESRVRGQIVGSGDLTAMSVVLVNSDGTVAHTAALDETGTFVVPAVRAGTWTLEAYGADLGFVEGTIPGPDGEPLSIEVPEGEAVDLGRVDVPVGATLSGIATAKGSGDPVYGAAIIAEVSGPIPIRRIGFTEPDGSWVIRGLPPGSWSLDLAYAPFCLADPGWVALGWPNAVDPDLGGRVDLEVGEEFVWDPVVPPDADNDRMDDLWEAEHALDPSRDDSGEDPDADGFTNLVEYRLGTDPRSVYTEGCEGCRSPGSTASFAGFLGALLTAAGRRRGPARRTPGSGAGRRG